MLSPPELLALAAARGVQVLAITDHDTTAAYSDAIFEQAATAGLELIGGIEASARTPHEDVHLLGLGVDPSDKDLLELTERVSRARVDRGRAIVDKLNGLGLDLPWSAVERRAGVVVTRPHVAGALVEAGHVTDLRDAFDRYLARGAPAHVPLRAISATDWIAAIQKAGGLAFLAHPGNATAHRTVTHLVDVGLDGFEVWHPSHDDTLVEYYRNLADRFGLLTSGGSDFHGRFEAESDRVGEFGPSRERWDQIKARWRG
jgi:predicted metal-dependent phosphoesterase TrpH